MVRLDPGFDILDTRMPPRPNPYPLELTPREGRPRPTNAQFAVWEKAKQEIDAEVAKVPTPVSDGVGPIKAGSTPSQAVFDKTVEKLGSVYGYVRAAYGYLERVAALPAGGNWDGGYGTNAFAALKTLERQLSFFKENGKTPLEAAVERYNVLRKRGERESDIASALGYTPTPAKPTYEQRLAKLKEEKAKLMVLPEHVRNPILMSILNQEKYLKEEFGIKGGRKTRKGNKKTKRTRKTKTRGRK